MSQRDSPPSPRPLSERCPTCDRPVASDAEWKRHEAEFPAEDCPAQNGSSAPHWCTAVCWGAEDCDMNAVDWRERAMEAEASHEAGDPPEGSRLWRCEKELAKARAELAAAIAQRDDAVKRAEKAEARISELEDAILLDDADDDIARTCGRNGMAVAVATEIRSRRGKNWEGVTVVHPLARAAMSAEVK